MPDPNIDILMYHSISNGDGPTSISARNFEFQMKFLAEANVPVISMDRMLEISNGVAALTTNSVVITFDDGFEDFGNAAWPILQEYGFASIVYIPTGHVGSTERWRGGDRPARKLMNWQTIRSLADAGVDFGSHTVTHPDLQLLSDDAIDLELTASKQELEDRIAKPIAHFAPPYGLMTNNVQNKISKHFATSVGTQLARAKEDSNIFNLPRLEMFYFTDPMRWRQHLSGHGDTYLRKRQIMRRMRSLALKPWRRL